MSEGQQTPQTGESEDAEPGMAESTEAGERPVTSGAESVARALERTGVETLFGVQGGAIMPVYDALYDSPLDHVTMAHEQGAAHAADAFGIVSGEPGVCLATSGPGATNLVTGLADASMDSDPVVALTGQVPSTMVGTDAFQETDTTGVTNPVTKENYFAGDADSVGDTVGEAFALADAGRQGPTLVDLPKDVTTGPTDNEPAAGTAPETYDPPERADSEAVATAAGVLARAEKPVILAGGGVIKGEACAELREFATEYGIPVVTTMPAVGAFPEDHELAMEMAGMHGTGYANMAITHCDAMFAVGTRFDDRLTGGVETFAPEAEIIHADIDAAEISKNIAADYPLLGEASVVIEQVHEAMADERAADMAATGERFQEWVEQCQQWQTDYPMDYPMDEDDPLKPQFVVETVDAATDDDTIVTTGVGQHQMWAVQYWTYTEPRTWVSSHGLGTMGYGLPSAIGARFAADDDQSVVCFDGDGSFLMTLQELAVAVRENLDITVFILNNEAVGMVRQWQDSFHGGRRMASEYPWVPDFAALAEAFGARGFRMEGHDEVADVVDDALAYDGPSVVDTFIDPTEDVYPMVPSGGSNGRFVLAEEQL
ncbi:biosynthetic-type acetolactate synthase large subunit [Halococcus thailandensis]|uniref:Acetolactate synthase n=1 Tax=Halococcus thailandensis JCM 13552 TaxID=1227457 RepID=M0MXE6_9EURY|nr:biosynthetic-type acetolactate synthase large subunit [Halococcus thailandensis]EMA50412.1 acetolactate synthase large subunit [Halococcus thailandensis JCM 13552]